jgi:hypothetical protein
MNLHPSTHPIFLYLLGAIAMAGIAAGVALATTGYSSAGPFAIAAACVGVLGTLASGATGGTYEPPSSDQPPSSEDD